MSGLRTNKTAGFVVLVSFLFFSGCVTGSGGRGVVNPVPGPAGGAAAVPPGQGQPGQPIPAQGGLGQPPAHRLPPAQLAGADVHWAGPVRFIKHSRTQADAQITQVAIGQTVSVRGEVVNSGEIPAETVIVKMENPQATPSGLSFTTIFGGLQPGETKTFTSPVFSYSTIGDKRVDLIIDPDNRLQNEMNRANNSAIGRIRVRSQRADEARCPNLKAVYIGARAAGTDHYIQYAVQGEPVELACLIDNTSGVNIHAKVEVRMLGTDELLGQFFIYVAAHTRGTGVITHSFERAGFNQFKMIIDPDRTTISEESMLDDNVVIGGVNITASEEPQSTQAVRRIEPTGVRLEQIPQPDARATSISFVPEGQFAAEGQTVVGQRGSVYAEFRNDGEKDMPFVNFCIKLDGRTIMQGERTAFSGETVRLRLDDIWFSSPGRHKLSLILDADNQLAEKKENNNTISCYVNVSDGAVQETQVPRTTTRTSGNVLTNIVSIFSDVSGRTAPTRTVTVPVATSIPTVSTTTMDGAESSSGSSASFTTYQTKETLDLKTYK